MPKGVFIRTKEHKKNISKRKKGVPNPKCSETRKRLFKEGKLIIYNKGKPNENRRNLNLISNPMKNSEVRLKNSIKQKELFIKGITNPPKNLGDYCKKGLITGKKSPNYGLKRSEETRKKLSLARKGIKRPKVSETRKRLFKEGKLLIHNKGKTKYDYEPLMKCSVSQKGEKNHNWIGGVSFLPYDKEFNKDFKMEIIKRDGFCCVKCGKTSMQNLMDFDKNLSIHHIDYNKDNININNLCSLCLRCHLETNYHRPQWTSFFQSLLSKKFGYTYIEFTQEKKYLKLGGMLR